MQVAWQKYECRLWKSEGLGENKYYIVYVFSDSPATREEKGRVVHRAISHLRLPPHCVGFSTALCWHTHLTISLSSCSLSLSSLTPAQWILLGPQALISLPPLPRFCFITRLFRQRALRRFISRLLLPSQWKKSFTCLFEALLKCAWSFITNWSYGLLSFMTKLQMETTSDPLTFCKLHKKYPNLLHYTCWIFLSWKQFYLTFNHIIVIRRPVSRRLRKELASALGMGLSVSILVFESESLNCRDMETVEACQFSLTIFIQNIFEVGRENLYGSSRPYRLTTRLFPFQ